MARSIEEELQRKASMALGILHKRNRFMSLKSLLKEMKKLQNQHLRGEETSFIKLDKEEEMNDEMNFEEGKTNKEREEKVKNILVDSTRIHELLAKSFYEANSTNKSNIQFKGYS